MRNRASFVTIARAIAALAVVWAAGACTHPSAHLMVDSPKLVQFQAPDVDEITGIDSDEAETVAPGNGSAQTPHK
jgi:hypothetical protein